MVKIKSSSLLQTIAFVRESFGQNASDRLVRGFPQGIQRKLELSVLDAWVEFDLFTVLLEQIVDVHFHGEASGIRASGRYAAEQEFPRRFGALSLPADLSLAEQLNSFAPMWRMLVDHGHIRVVASEGELALHLCDFPVATEVYGNRVAGWLEGYIERLTGEPWKIELTVNDPGPGSTYVFHMVVDKPAH